MFCLWPLLGNLLGLFWHCGFWPGSRACLQITMSFVQKQIEKPILSIQDIVFHNFKQQVCHVYGTCSVAGEETFTAYWTFLSPFGYLQYQLPTVLILLSSALYLFGYNNWIYVLLKIDLNNLKKWRSIISRGCISESTNHNLVLLLLVWANILYLKICLANGHWKSAARTSSKLVYQKPC